MAIEEQHVALPKLYGAPAYARPEPLVPPSPRPLDADDLPLEAIQTEAERQLAASLPIYPYGPDSYGGADDRSRLEPRLTGRPLSLRALAGRILGERGN